MKKFLACTALASVIGLALSACGSTSDPVAMQAKTTLAKRLLSGSNSSGIIPITDSATATCVADGFVDKVGVKNLASYGLVDAQGNVPTSSPAVTPTPASTQDATAIADTLIRCVGEDKVDAQVRSQLTASSKLSPAARACAVNLLDAPTIRILLITKVEGQQPQAQAALAPIVTKLNTCLKFK